MKKIILSLSTIIAFSLSASEIVYLANCKLNTPLDPINIEIAKIGDEVGANIESGPYGYFVSAPWNNQISNQIKVTAEENGFTLTATSDVFSYVTINFATGRGQILQRLQPEYYDCLAGGSPNGCLVLNTVLHSCKKIDYTPELFDTASN